MLYMGESCLSVCAPARVSLNENIFHKVLLDWIERIHNEWQLVHACSSESWKVNEWSTSRVYPTIQFESTGRRVHDTGINTLGQRSLILNPSSSPRYIASTMV